jgi:hypothetical protein
LILGAGASEAFDWFSIVARKPPPLDAATAWFGRCWGGACLFAR